MTPGKRWTPPDEDPDYEKLAAVLPSVKATRFAGGLRPTLTATARGSASIPQVGTEGWSAVEQKD